MKIQRFECVLASDLFRKRQAVWQALVESEPDFTWGNNNHTLVDLFSIINHLEMTDSCSERQLDGLRKAGGKLPHGLNTYVDLEN